MGLCISTQKTQKQKPKQQKALKSNIENVDVVKAKLKHARDRIKNYISAKKNDIQKLTAQIKQKIPLYEQTNNKKPLVPLLQARRSLQKLVQQAQLKLRVVLDSIEQVEMSKMNAQMVNVLDDSNKYIKQIHDQLQAKDWRNVLAQAQQKYEIEWPDDSEQIQQDPQFQAMWKQIGGDKIQTHNKNNKIVQGKKINVQISKNKQKQLQAA